MHAVYQKEKDLTAAAGVDWELEDRRHDNLVITLFVIFIIGWLLLSRNLDDGAGFLEADISLQHLILGRHHLMKRELSFTDESMNGQVLQLLDVVNIIHDHLESLLLFELIRYIKALDPLGVEVIHDHLRHPNLRPQMPRASPFLLIEHGHAISPRKRVHVWQLFAAERQP